MDLQQQIQRMFESITLGNNVFYKSQQKDEEDLDQVQKIAILRDLYQNKPNLFLERYRQYIEPEFTPLLYGKACEEFFLDHLITHAQEGSNRNRLIKNNRYLAMQELRREGSYFSNEKMREREPYLFETMVERYMNDNEKVQLRPTVDISDSNRSEFSKLIEQFDITQRVSDRRKHFLEKFQMDLSGSDCTSNFLNHVENRTVEADREEQESFDFTMEFDSSDDEGREMERSRILEGRIGHRHCAKNDGTVVMRRLRDRRNAATKLKSEEEKASEALSTMRLTSNLQGSANEDREWSSGDEHDSEPTGLLRDQLYNEFVSLMEQRFLDGKDAQFFDYSQVDAGHGLHGCKVDSIYEQDMEDAYFDSEEPE